MKRLYDLIASHEDWLIDQILYHAKERNYVKYTSTLKEAWRKSIAGLSQALLAALQTNDHAPELGPDNDFTRDPIAFFGISEAKRHRERGINLGMFLGLMKYYRQSYIDLILKVNFDQDYEERCQLFVERVFDHIELGFCVEWAETDNSKLINELQARNRSMTNEKNKYLTVFESLSNPVILLDKDNQINTMNHAASVLLRGSHAPGAYYYGEDQMEDTLPWLTNELRAFTGSNDPELSFEKKLENENSRHFEIKLARVLDVSEKFRGTVVILNDITERKRVEQELQHRVEFNKLINTISTNFINLAPDEIDRGINHALQAIGEFAGVDRSYVFLLSDNGTKMDNTHEWCAEGIEPQINNLKRLPVKDFPWWMEKLNRFENIYIPRVANLPPEASAEIVILQAQGIQSLIAVPMVYGKSLVGFLGFDSVRAEKTWWEEIIALLKIVGEIFSNTLEHKLAEEALRLSNERFSKTFNLSPDSMFIVTPTAGQYIDVNNSFLHTTGYCRQDVIGRTPIELNIFAPEDHVKLIQMILERGAIRNLEDNFRMKSGEERVGLVSAEIIELNGEQCILGVLNDITERKQLEKEMARLDRLHLIGEMAAGIGHEIRNPMTTVRGFLQMFRGKEECTKYKEFFDLMIEELDRTNSIIKEYLSLAKDKAVDLKLQNLNSIVKALSPLIQSDAIMSDKYVKLELEDIPDLLLDEKEIRQIILNLARNGLEAMSPGGNLTIKTFNEGEEVVLAVQDQGIGIEPHLLEKIGTPFFTTKDYGTGLGLAVCYSIAVRHKATIKVETGPTVTTFFVRFKL